MGIDIKSIFKKNLKQLALLLLFVIIAYFNSLANDFVVDDLAIKESKTIGSIAYILTSPQYFVQPLIYNIIYKIGRFNPTLFRVGNIIFHLFTVWTIYFLVTFLTKKRVGFFVAALFAVHPVLTESVTWISGGNYTRYSFFLLASFLFYLVAYRLKKNIYNVFSLSLFILSLFSHPFALTLPLILLVYELVLSDIKKNWKKIVPYFAISSIWLVSYLLNLQSRSESIFSQPNAVGSKVYNPLIQIPFVIVNYLKLILWPDHLTIYHAESLISLSFYSIFLLMFIFFCLFATYLYKKNKLILFWLIFFVISISPTLMFVKISWNIAERYIYLGALGILFPIGYYLAGLTKLINNTKVINGIFIFILFFLTLRTVNRNFDWKNEESLWTATAKTSPNYDKSHLNLGNVYLKKKEYSSAIREFKQVIEINPNNWLPYNLLSLIYFDQKDYLEAEKYTKQAIKVAPANGELYLNLALIYQKQNKIKQARQICLQVLKQDPENNRARLILSELSD